MRRTKDVWASCDPGKTGAVVVWKGNIPTLLYRIEVPKGQRFFEQAQADMLSEAFHPCHFLVMEALLGVRMPQHSTIHADTTATNHGFIQGVYWEAAAASRGIELIRPNQWKQALGLTKDKEASLDMAREQFPEWEPEFRRKKDHDVAEAFLIGHEYLLRQDNT